MSTVKPPILIKVAAHRGLAEAQLYLSRAFRSGELGDTVNVEKALMWLERAALDGKMAEAQYELGLVYLKGVDRPKNLEKARELTELAAAQGHKDAQKQAMILLNTFVI